MCISCLNASEPREPARQLVFEGHRQTRRDFLRATSTLGLALALGVSSYAAPPPHAAPPVAKPIRFTRRVREVTRKLNIPVGRWKIIVLHHSATPEGNAATFDREHRARGMENGLAYHFLIGNGRGSGDGEIEVGTRWIRQIQGGHVRDRLQLKGGESVNQVGIGICLVGNFETTRPTKKQLAALHELLEYLRTEVTGRKVRCAVHQHVDPGHTACPGRRFPTAEMMRRYR